MRNCRCKQRRKKIREGESCKGANTAQNEKQSKQDDEEREKKKKMVKQ